MLAGVTFTCLYSDRVLLLLISTFPFSSLFFCFVLFCRPLPHSDAAVHGRGRPLQFGGVATHPQTAGRWQRRGDRGQRERGGELGAYTFEIRAVTMNLRRWVSRKWAMKRVKSWKVAGPDDISVEVWRWRGEGAVDSTGSFNTADLF